MAHPIDLRLGRWEDVLGDVECDCLLVDAPYSERTHAGHDEFAKNERIDRGERRPLNYSAWSEADVRSFVGAWAGRRTRGWFVSITDHFLAPTWAAALADCGRYVFSPIAYVATGSRVRIAGDGPAQWSCWVIVARPRSATFVKWGALPGAYVLPPMQEGRFSKVVGGKPEWLMRSLVRDYSRPGDLICDPCAGGGTTLLAAAIEGRRAVGAEMDPKHYAIAQKRIGRGYTPTLFADEAPAREQAQLFAEGEG